MGATAKVLLIAAKVASLVSLPILALGYLFFLSSHSELTHLYAWITFAGLVLTLVCAPGHIRYLGALYAVVASCAAVLGVWKIHEHLTFFQGPEYSAAAMCAIDVAAIVVGYGSCRYLASNGTDT
jgi:hypothetical protein